MVAHGKYIFRKWFLVWPCVGCKMISVFILPSNIIFRKTERERERSRLRVKTEEEERAHHRRPTSFDIADDPETSRHEPRLPFDFDFESHPDRTLWLRRWTQRPGSHAFDFANFAHHRLHQDGIKTGPITPIELRSRLRNGWVLMNLTGFDEYFLVGFWWIWPDLCLSIEKWYYIFVWKLRKCEKMWETRRKCVFYIIFSNTTKH